jgi:ribosomal protein S18 acetylase RimI-like enzyme
LIAREADHRGDSQNERQTIPATIPLQNDAETAPNGQHNSVIRFRSFRNSDPPKLTELWNLGIPSPAVARPLRVHELDAHAFGSITFDANGLIVAEEEGSVVGFAHAGFGPPESPAETPPCQVDPTIGTIAMMVVAPGRDSPKIRLGLLRRAEDYLLERGTKVIYLGGQSPLNPFYWGLYGGSEFSGILSGHTDAHRAAREAGYQPVSSTIVLEANLDQPPPRDPKAVILRRQSQVSFHEEEPPTSWWESLALGDFHPTLVRLNSKADAEIIAQAGMWDMSWFGRADGLARVGIIHVEVASAFRRNGYGRFLINEILRLAREQMFAVAQVQANATNEAALALYNSSGFQPIDEATLYRLPADRMERRG